MAEPDERPVTLEELFVSSLAQIDALAEVVDCEGADQFCHSFFPVFCDFKVGGFVNGATASRNVTLVHSMICAIASYTTVSKFSFPR